MFGPVHSKWRKQQRLWRESLSQDRYTVKEAAKAMNVSERQVRELIESNELTATRKTPRNTLIPKEAIVEYMVPMPKAVRELRKTLGGPFGFLHDEF